MNLRGGEFMRCVVAEGVPIVVGLGRLALSTIGLPPPSVWSFSWVTYSVNDHANKIAAIRNEIIAGIMEYE
jgi:hypothetical protein